MPKELHEKLEKQADKKKLKGKKRDAYVYGTLNKIEKAKKEKESKSGHGNKTVATESIPIHLRW